MDILTKIALCLLVIAVSLLVCHFISEAIRDPESERKPFWWVFFFGIIGAILYVLLTIRERQVESDNVTKWLEPVKRPSPEEEEFRQGADFAKEFDLMTNALDDATGELETAKKKLEFLEKRVSTDAPDLYKEYLYFCKTKVEK